MLIDHQFFLTSQRMSTQEAPEAVFKTYEPLAESTVKGWVGETTFQGVLDIAAQKADFDAGEPGATEPGAADLEKLHQFKCAVAVMTLIPIIPISNITIGDFGVVRSNTTQNFGVGTFSVASQREVIQAADDLESRAKRYIEQYIPVTVPRLYKVT